MSPAAVTALTALQALPLDERQQVLYLVKEHVDEEVFVEECERELDAMEAGTVETFTLKEALAYSSEKVREALAARSVSSLPAA
jgi:hypothetical protein